VRKLLNTLYIVTPDAYLSLDGNNAVLLKDNEVLFRIPVNNIEGIVCFNYLGASPKFMHYCTDRNIRVSFISPTGRYMAGIYGAVKGNVLLRKKQYFMSEDETFCLDISKTILKAKLFNCRYEVNRSLRDNKDKINAAKLQDTALKLRASISDIDACCSADALRGVEGDCARQYFSSFDDMIIAQKEDFSFSGRTKRPPLDKVNALLSFGYALLAHDVESALLSVGLDPFVGFMHTDRPGRISLALDIMEELRATTVDRLVLSAINLKQLNDKDFVRKESGAVVLTDDARKVFLTLWQKKKQESIRHDYTGEQISYGLIPYVQALILSRYLRGEINAYVPFFRK
jgi:CRISPR-associated protein Cas1